MACRAAAGQINPVGKENHMAYLVEAFLYVGLLIIHLIKWGGWFGSSV